MYTKVLEVEGESRLVFFARTDIKPGQELTYDYRLVRYLLHNTRCWEAHAKHIYYQYQLQHLSPNSVLAESEVVLACFAVIHSMV